jgi:hypothetical protein
LAPFPTIASASAASLQPAATVGGTVDVAGHHLDGTGRAALLMNARFQIEQEVAAAAGVSSTSLQFVVPDLPVGVYELALRVTRTGEAQPRTSNRVALVIGPQIVTPLPATIVRDGTGAATVSLNCQPEIRPGQRVSLILGTREVPAEPFTAATASLTFIVQAAPPGEHLVRLRVDGIESPIIDRAATPPAFFNRRIAIL